MHGNEEEEGCVRDRPCELRRKKPASNTAAGTRAQRKCGTVRRTERVKPQPVRSAHGARNCMKSGESVETTSFRGGVSAEEDLSCPSTRNALCKVGLLPFSFQPWQPFARGGLSLFLFPFSLRGKRSAREIWRKKEKREAKGKQKWTNGIYYTKRREG